MSLIKHLNEPFHTTETDPLSTPESSESDQFSLYCSLFHPQYCPDSLSSGVEYHHHLLIIECLEQDLYFADTLISYPHAHRVWYIVNRRSTLFALVSSLLYSEPRKNCLQLCAFLCIVGFIGLLEITPLIE